MIIAISGKKRTGKDLIGKIITYLISTHGNNNVASFEKCLEHNSSFLYPMGWKIVKYADKLKDMVCLLIGCTREQLEDETFKNTELGEEWKYWKINWTDEIGIGYERIYTTEEEYNTKIEELERIINDIFISQEGYYTPRQILQYIGTDLFRNQFHPNTWVNATMAGYDSAGPHWIITDCRFPNEVQAVKDKKGINIRVNRKYECTFCESRSTRPKISGVKCDNCGKFTPYTNNQIHESEVALDFYKDFDYVIENDGTIKQLIEQIREILKVEKII